MTPLVQDVHALLPQTQCTKCGYDGCLPYATAIVEGEAINRCPPGGDEGIAKLAALLEQPKLPLNTEECGEHQPFAIALIEERHCIGCTLCIQACPVDAILGANKFMHTVLPERCTGCELCIAPCPVDCITMVPAGRTWTEEDASQAWEHYQAHTARIELAKQAEQRRLATAAERTLSKKQADTSTSQASETPQDSKQAAIMAALAKARARRQQAS